MVRTNHRNKIRVWAGGSTAFLSVPQQQQPLHFVARKAACSRSHVRSREQQQSLLPAVEVRLGLVFPRSLYMVLDFGAIPILLDTMAEESARLPLFRRFENIVGPRLARGVECVRATRRDASVNNSILMYCGIHPEPSPARW